MMRKVKESNRFSRSKLQVKEQKEARAIHQEKFTNYDRLYILASLDLIDRKQKGEISRINTSNKKEILDSLKELAKKDM